MIVHNDPFFMLFFGDERTSLERDILMNDCAQEQLWNYCSLAKIKKIMNLETLMLLKQTHSNQGFIVSDASIQTLLTEKAEGDFLITRSECIGLAVYTADCLPIVFYDSYNRVVAICHAGWAGSVNQIAIKTLQKMQQEFGTIFDHVRVFFGPSAKKCCYEVTDEFKERIPLAIQEQVFVTAHNKLFFDLPLFNKLQLESMGLSKESFHNHYNVCTMCDNSFCSNRRDKEKTKRQLTVVALK